jgi:hypothetical protein
LLPLDTTRRHNIPSTTVERSLIDIAATSPQELNRAVEQAFVKKLTRTPSRRTGAAISTSSWPGTM